MVRKHVIFSKQAHIKGNYVVILDIITFLTMRRFFPQKKISPFMIFLNFYCRSIGTSLFNNHAFYTMYWHMHAWRVVITFVLNAGVCLIWLKRLFKSCCYPLCLEMVTFKSIYICRIREVINSAFIKWNTVIF